MRLSSIRLAGFKSFVDNTSVNLPSSLVGIVGPNGCGKSNTIDAVRWVMGESSAKLLRGESMDDVIFAGSTSRKPVGQAFVELVFDNSQGKLGGEYGHYNELAIRREVARDGTSKYFLNNSRCRRRDIRDIFLGTGLGPRSYAIIEQGMISRLIEAKPEDLRVYLEEAAGISKYKERRRETENRIRHTRDNLDRLNDLREEVDKQLAHLQRQARTAEKYQLLKQEEREVAGQTLTLRWSEHRESLQGRDESIRAREVELESIIADQRGAEASIETERQSHTAASEALNQAQANFYKLGSEVSRTEQQIKHTRESREQQNNELAQIEKSLQEAREHIEQDTRRIDEIDRGMNSDLPAYEKLRESQKISADLLSQSEQQLQEWQTRWDQHNEQHTATSQVAQVELSRIDQMERGIAQSEKRVQRLELELGSLGIDNLSQDIERWIGEEVEIAAEEQRLQENIRSTNENVQRIREQHQRLTAELDGVRGEAQSMIGRLASLEALQQSALGSDDNRATEWLQQQGLAQAPRLAQQLRVNEGWETAVERVLGDYLEAVCVPDVAALAERLQQHDHAPLTLFGGAAEPVVTSTAGNVPLPLLTSLIESSTPVGDLLAGVYAADSLRDALQHRESLQTGESVVTRDGIWLARHWLRCGVADAGQSVLQREQEIAATRETLAELEARSEDLDERIQQANEKMAEHEARRDTVQHSFNQVLRQVSEVKSGLVASQQKLEQAHTRQTRLQEEIAEVTQIRQQDAGIIKQASERRAEALEELDVLGKRGDQLRAENAELQQKLDEARQLADADRDAGQELAIRVESLKAARESTQENLRRMHSQVEQFSERQEQLELLLTSDEEDPLIALEASLEGMLSAHLASETSLQSARGELEKIEQRLRQHEQARVRHENRAASVREGLQNEKLESQEVRVRIKTLEEQAEEHEYQLHELVKSLPEDLTLVASQQHLEELERKISRLGPINLAAIDEFDEQAQRKEYLDSQHADVTDALATLEAAIAKIDRETRARFKETFDQVNARVKDFFPRLFGGGRAELEMTGDDLLSTGVSVLAQPPGKKITSIQLLSGGEKALTAVALVFAFFELNPSPFCMLDEVDAPLDDANVGRFCALVKEMSERVQFIFITHNKITMELAEQLMGVTMNEPGVSRLVAVDVDQAVELANA